MNRKTHQVSISISHSISLSYFLSITIESICISSSVQNLFLKERKMENLINYKKENNKEKKHYLSS